MADYWEEFVTGRPGVVLAHDREGRITAVGHDGTSVSIEDGRAMAETNYVCPVCGRPMLSASEGCSGGFLDTDHPPSVAPVVASAPVRVTRTSDEDRA